MTPPAPSSDPSSCHHWLHRVDVLFCSLKGFWSSGIQRKAWKMSQSEISVFKVIPTPVMSRGPSPCAVPRSSAGPCRPSLCHCFSVLVASFPKRTCKHVHAHPLFRNFTIVFKTEGRKVNLNSARSAEQSKERWGLNGWGWEWAAKCKPNETHSWVLGQDWGAAASARGLGAVPGPCQAPCGHQPPADFQRTTVAPHACLPPAEHKQKQLGPARLRPTSRLAICTHAQRAVPGYNSSNISHARDRGANDKPEALAHPPPARLGPAHPTSPSLLLQACSSAGFCSPPRTGSPLLGGSPSCRHPPSSPIMPSTLLTCLALQRVLLSTVSSDNISCPHLKAPCNIQGAARGSVPRCEASLINPVN